MKSENSDLFYEYYQEENLLWEKWKRKTPDAFPDTSLPAYKKTEEIFWFFRRTLWEEGLVLDPMQADIWPNFEEDLEDIDYDHIGPHISVSWTRLTRNSSSPGSLSLQINKEGKFDFFYTDFKGNYTDLCEGKEEDFLHTLEDCDLYMLSYFRKFSTIP